MASWTETIKAALRKDRPPAPKKPVAPRPHNIPVGDANASDIPAGDGWLIGAKDISNVLGVSLRSFFRMKEHGQLPFLRRFPGVGPGRTCDRVTCRRDEIEAWKLGRQTIGTAEQPREKVEVGEDAVADAVADDREAVEEKQETPAAATPTGGRKEDWKNL